MDGISLITLSAELFRPQQILLVCDRLTIMEAALRGMLLDTLQI
jgi:hypothetical protein